MDSRKPKLATSNPAEIVTISMSRRVGRRLGLPRANSHKLANKRAEIAKQTYTESEIRSGCPLTKSESKRMTRPASEQAKATRAKSAVRCWT